MSHAVFNSNTLASGTNIPASGSTELELSAALGSTIGKISVNNGCASPVNLYIGATGALVLIMTVGIGVYPQIDCVIPKGARLSVRAVPNSALNTGNFTITGWG